MDIEAARWIYTAIAAPLLGAIGGWLRGFLIDRRTAKRRKKAILLKLSGLPPEAKAELIEFHQHGTQTRRADPGKPTIRLLAHEGILSVGPGRGTYDAIDRYLTIRPDVWELMRDWIVSDAIAISAVMDEFFEPVEHVDSK